MKLHEATKILVMIHGLAPVVRALAFHAGEAAGAVDHADAEAFRVLADALADAAARVPGAPVRAA